MSTASASVMPRRCLGDGRKEEKVKEEVARMGASTTIRQVVLVLLCQMHACYAYRAAVALPSGENWHIPSYPGSGRLVLSHSGKLVPRRYTLG